MGVLAASLDHLFAVAFSGQRRSNLAFSRPTVVGIKNLRTHFVSTLREDRRHIFLGIFGGHIAGGNFLFCGLVSDDVTVLGDFRLPRCSACISVTGMSFLMIFGALESWEPDDHAS